MRTTILLAAVVGGSFLAAPAFAQEAKAPFTGPRVDALAGWDRVEDGSIDGEGRDGFVYGGQIGYDYQAGKLVLGVEGEITGATTKDSFTGGIVPGDELRVSAGRDLYAGARVGFAVGDRALVYAKGGYTNARFDVRYRSGSTTVEDHETVDGWRLGAGAEVKLTRKLHAKAEYRYSRYDDESSGVEGDRHQLLAGIGVRF